MLQLKHPGVYTQEIPSGVRAISGAPTSVALFVGPTVTGIDGRPIRVMSFGDFERSFGGLSQRSSLSYSVLHFFANGGGEAYVIRVPADGAVAASTSLKQDNGPNTDQALVIEALSSGAGGNELYVEIDPFGIGAKPYDTGHDKKRYNLSLHDRLTGRSERFGDLATDSGGARFAPAVVNDIGTGSKLVELTMPPTALGDEGPQPTGAIYSIDNPPAAGLPFSSDIKLRVSVAVLADDGTAAAGSSLTDFAVTVFPNGSERPKSALELITRMTAAINGAIRADAAANALMEGVAIEAELFENGRLFRLRTSAPGPQALTKRLADATVTIKAPASGTSFLAAGQYDVKQKVANPSRYRLGADYGTSQIFGTPTDGVDGTTSGGQPKTDAFKNAVLALETPDPFFNLLCLPDLVRPAANDPNALHHAAAMSIYGEAARICREKHAFLLVDPFPGIGDVGAAEAWKSGAFTFQSSHAAAYFPNIRVDDPLQAGAIRSHPPSGAIAGLYARTDGNFGVWQAPAGTEASLNGVYGPSAVLSDDEHGILNPLGLNVIRRFPIYGTVSFGSRTVDGANAMASEWKYIPVRRTASYILRSLSEGLRWAVHKPNGEALWADLRMNVTSFMHGLFRQGAFKGVSAREAYFVQCDAGTTTPDDINLGVVNIIVGFAPLRPAEFVVISLKQIVRPAA